MKISYKDFAYLMNFEMPHPFIKYCCNCYATEIDGDVQLAAHIKLPLYLLFFLPIQFIEIFHAAWSYGLKNYSICEREVTSLMWFTIYDTKYKEWKKQCGI